MKNKKLILSPKDNIGKIVLQNVDTFCLEGDTLLVVFEDGGTRNYPLAHLWYYESHVSYHKVALVSDEDGKAQVWTGGGDNPQAINYLDTVESNPVGVGEGVGFDLTDDSGIHTPDSDNRADRYREILDKELVASEKDSSDSTDPYVRGFVIGWKECLDLLDREFKRVENES